MDYWQKHPEVLQHKKDHERIFQNKLQFVDETGNQIPGNFTVYKDLMVFTELGKCNYFGGRCLLAINTVKNVKERKATQRSLYTFETGIATDNVEFDFTSDDKYLLR